jgi:hypothetical protein
MNSRRFLKASVTNILPSASTLSTISTPRFFACSRQPSGPAPSLSSGRQIERHLPVAAGDDIALDFKIGNRGLDPEPGFNVGGLESPESDQSPDAGIEQVTAATGKLLVIQDKPGEFGGHGLWLSGGNGIVDGGELGRLPGVVSTMQAVEFAQHGVNGGAAFLRIGIDDQNLDPGAEDVGLLLLDGGRPACSRPGR